VWSPCEAIGGVRSTGAAPTAASLPETVSEPNSGVRKDEGRGQGARSQSWARGGASSAALVGCSAARRPVTVEPRVQCGGAERGGGARVWGGCGIGDEGLKESADGTAAKCHGGKQSSQGGLKEGDGNLGVALGENGQRGSRRAWRGRYCEGGRRERRGKALTCGVREPEREGRRYSSGWPMESGDRRMGSGDRPMGNGDRPMWSELASAQVELGGRCGAEAADGSRAQPMRTNWEIGRRGKEKKGGAGGLLADFSFLSLLFFSFSNSLNSI
jgi:hypothetical protein